MHDHTPEPTPPLLPPEPSIAIERQALGLPPMLSPAAATPPPQRPGTGLIVALLLVGLVHLALAIPASVPAHGPSMLSYRLGYIMAGLVIWPLIIVGLFSIARRFRNLRSQLIIVLVIWSLSSLSHLGNVVRTLKPPAHADRAKAPTAEELAPFILPAKAQGQPVALPQPPVADASVPVENFDFSPGSDERLIQVIDGAQQERYRVITAAYLRAGAARPRDAVLALERVRFIEHFANSEDGVIESANEDYEAALADLTARFPTAPGTILYQLNQEYGEELETKAKAQEHLARRWNAAERAEFALLRAQAAADDAPRALAFARESFDLHPTVDAGLLRAEGALATKDGRDECLRTLAHPVFSTAVPWSKRAKLLLLLKAGAASPALDLLAELEASNPDLVRTTEIAAGLAKAGRIAQARAIYAAVPVNQWTQEDIHRERFKFELEHGNQEQALAAYRQFRAGGIHTDFFFRERFALFLEFPAAPWTWIDLGGVLLFSLCVVVIAGAPLLLLLPVHYWSLLREKKGKTGSWPEARWGLREAWLALGALLLGDFLALWWLAPTGLAKWFTDEDATAVFPNVLLRMQVISWSALGACLVFLFWRSRAWRFFGPGQWGFGRAVGLSLALLFALRVALGIYVQIFPAATAGEIAASTPQITKLANEILATLGPWGLCGLLVVVVPVLEEALFRGVVLQGLAKHVPFAWANATQAALFALVHENTLLFPFFFTFGCVCGALTRRAHGLFPALLFHMGNNLLACLGLLVVKHLVR